MNLEESLTYSDVLIKPKFSMLRSRREATLDHTLFGVKLGHVLISSNMDSVTSPQMAAAMSKAGGLSALHRFQTIDQNVEQFYASIDLAANALNASPFNKKPIGSFGIGDTEYERAMALYDAGAEILLLDVAHGAAIHVVEQYDRVRSRVGDNAAIIVGNFDNYESLKAYLDHVKSRRKPDGIKVGVGNGAACITRVVTGCGGGMISALIDCSLVGIPLIADGGAKNSGDVAKALAAGASAVMMGSILAGTEEAPGERVWKSNVHKVDTFLTKEEVYPTKNGQLDTSVEINLPSFKTYRGSASRESYEVQGKVDTHRTPEGESMLVEYKGPVAPILESMAAGLKSSMAYVGAYDLTSFKENAKLVKVSMSTHIESAAHGKSKN